MHRDRIRQKLQDREGGNTLPRAAFADQSHGLAAVELERDALDGLDRVRSGAAGESDAEIADIEKWRRNTASGAQSTTLRGSNASRTASPTKIKRLSIVASTKNAVKPSHGACRLDLPWASSSPSDGDPGGSPKPRKSSEVSVVIDPFRMNGRKVIV